jgi:hypothetical protein
MKQLLSMLVLLSADGGGFSNLIHGPMTMVPGTEADCLSIAYPAIRDELQRRHPDDDQRRAATNYHFAVFTEGTKCVVVAGRKGRTTYGVEVWVEGGRVVSLF